MREVAAGCFPKTTDVAPTVAQILGFKMVECEGKPLAELAF
jgi:hypothetical protein